MSDSVPQSDLWVLPPPRQSAWFAKVDWYLNWQMSKGLSYAGLHLPMRTIEIAEHFEGELPKAPERSDEAPLLVLSHDRLPASKCLVVDGAENLKKWLTHIQTLALNLNVDSIHIFLPEAATRENAVKIWGAGKFTVTFSTDNDARGGWHEMEPTGS